MTSYHDELAALAKAIGSDGCTHAADWYVECCWEHDASYRRGVTLRGVPITKAHADQRFRDCIQANSGLRFLNPLSWWRWAAVSWFGRGIWATQTPQRLLTQSPPATAAILQDAKAARLAILREEGWL